LKGSLAIRLIELVRQRLQPQLLFADLDGTLIVEPNGMGPNVTNLIEVTSATGGSLVPTSARPITHLAKLFHDHSQVSFAIGNGGAIIAKIRSVDDYLVLNEETLAAEDGVDCVSDLYRWQEEGRGIMFLFHDSHALFEVGAVGDTSVLDPQDLAVIIGDRPLRHAVDISPSQRLLSVSFLAPLEPDQVRTLLSPSKMPMFWRASVYPEFRVPGWSWLEIFPKSANKAEACRRVIQLWSTEFCKKPVVTAIGDAPDDIEMLRMADRSYCPSTASEEVRRAVSEVLVQSGGNDFAAAVATRIKAATYS
jgi:hydroxymethylpyrimidine pyrophosphatase-like HAD family hydrolase